MFKLQSPFKITPDQQNAVNLLTKKYREGIDRQVLLGVTGSGKTYTMAQVVQQLQIPALVISHNKTLAGQLYQEMRDFFPENAVSYFVSYYDYYQPEAYIPSSDTYIEKEAQINDTIDKLRLAATSNIMTRKDVIVVSSVSCIYNIGSPTEYGKFILSLGVGEMASQESIARRLIELQYDRSEFDYKRGTFRLRGEHVDVYLAYDDTGFRITIENDRITEISSRDPLTGKILNNEPIKTVVIYPAKHYLIEKEVYMGAEQQIRSDMVKEVKALQDQGKIVEAQRLSQKVTYDLEMLLEVGYINGIENYSRYFDGRKPGGKPNSLLDFFQTQYGDDWIVMIDESHMTLPQIRGMYNGDHSRKQTLIDYGFRLQAALDNRPLKFSEFYDLVKKALYVSATPNEWEIEDAKNNVVEQIVRPTGIVDPHIDIRPTDGDIEDCVKEIKIRVEKKQRVLVTTLTKRTAEDLSSYLKEQGVNAVYLHSDIKTLERTDILHKLRTKEYDVLVGVNLLREGLDLPEVSLVVILDGDKEGFLRSRTSLIQTMGRAARHLEGEVIIYADEITRSMKAAIDEVDRRREYQLAYNEKHHITPHSIEKEIKSEIAKTEYIVPLDQQKDIANKLDTISEQALTPLDKKKVSTQLQKEMKRYADNLDFETAILIRDKLRDIKS
ncbi:excinuclease ABC subunit UvrB [Candidatus Woesebacteria bacterium]|nr:excinuclease ABC subunit UvrB [Candidatus Woesebacteria bacterium]